MPLLHVSQCVSVVEADNSCSCSHFESAGLWAAIECCLLLLSKQLLMQVVLQHSRSILVILSHTLTVTGELPNPHVWWVTEGTGSPNKRGDLSSLNPRNLWSGRNIGGNVKSFIPTPCSGKHFGLDLTDGFLNVSHVCCELAGQSLFCLRTVSKEHDGTLSCSNPASMSQQSTPTSLHGNDGWEESPWTSWYDNLIPKWNDRKESLWHWCNNTLSLKAGTKHKMLGKARKKCSLCCVVIQNDVAEHCLCDSYHAPTEIPSVSTYC